MLWFVIAFKTPGLKPGAPKRKHQPVGILAATVALCLNWTAAAAVLLLLLTSGTYVQVRVVATAFLKAVQVGLTP